MSKKNGCWHGIKTDILRITYSIFQILISKSVLLFFTFDPTSFNYIELIIHDFHFCPCLSKFVDIPYINYFGTIMVYELRTLQILPKPFHFHAALLARLAWHAQNCWTTSKIFSGSLKKKTSVSIKNLINIVRYIKQVFY